MIFCENSRVSISTYKLCTLFLVVQLVMMPHTAHAQWSQTLGWGGAGHGKRSPGMLTDDSAKQLNRASCLPNPLVLRIVKRLIEDEFKRQEICQIGLKSRETRDSIYED